MTMNTQTIAQEILGNLSRFNLPDEDIQTYENLGVLVGIYDNRPFGDDLYIYQNGIYWNVNGVNYCVYFNTIQALHFKKDGKTGNYITIENMAGDLLNLPIRGQTEKTNDAHEFIQFFNQVI